MHATDDISHAEGDLYWATKSYGGGHGIWNTIYCLGRYMRLCGVLPLWSLTLDDMLQASTSVQIRRYRSTMNGEHNCTKCSPENYLQIHNYKVEYNPDFDSEIPSYWATEVWWQSPPKGGYTSRYDTEWRRLMRLVVSGATTFKREGWPYGNQPQPIPQTLTVMEVRREIKAMCTYR